jgi:hypothetical protein
LLVDGFDHPPYGLQLCTLLVGAALAAKRLHKNNSYDAEIVVQRIDAIRVIERVRSC